jgi:YD repeat-containing protein
MLRITLSLLLSVFVGLSSLQAQKLHQIKAEITLAGQEAKPYFEKVYNKRGNLVRDIDHLQQIYSEYVYDAAGRVMSAKLDEMGVKSVTTYSYAPEYVTITQNDLTFGETRTLHKYLRPDGKVREIVSPKTREVFAYNEKDSLAGETYYVMKDGAMQLKYKRVIHYDEQGRRTGRTHYDASGKEIYYVRRHFDEMGRLVEHEERDLVHNIYKLEERSYDVHGRLTVVAESDFGNDVHYVTTYLYFPSGDLQKQLVTEERNGKVQLIKHIEHKYRNQQLWKVITQEGDRRTVDTYDGEYKHFTEVFKENTLLSSISYTYSFFE